MRAELLREGDTLKLKRDHNYGPEYDVVTITSIRGVKGYKREYFYTAAGEAFEARDFARHATPQEIGPS